MRKHIAAMCLAIAACCSVFCSSAASEANIDYECRRDQYVLAEEEKRLRLEELRTARKIDDLYLELKEKHRKLEDERSKLDEIRRRLLCIRYKVTY